MTREERRRYQDQLADEAAAAGVVHPNDPPRVTDPCPARLGGNHDFSMKGNDGLKRCWYCAKARGDA